MKISFDPAKRDLTLKHRGLDFARTVEVFAGRTATVVADRRDYGETRFITAGRLDSRLMVLVWTQRGEARHVHLDEALSCQGRRNLAPPHGLIAMTRRS